jgi:hypothetical protein
MWEKSVYDVIQGGTYNLDILLEGPSRITNISIGAAYFLAQIQAGHIPDEIRSSSAELFCRSSFPTLPNDMSTGSFKASSPRGAI